MPSHFTFSGQPGEKGSDTAMPKCSAATPATCPSAILTLLFVCLLTPMARASTLLERKIYDPYIVCANPPPPIYSFPAGYSFFDYPNTLDLCSAANGLRGRNVGCFCSNPHDEVHCDSDRADPTLAGTTLSSSQNGTLIHVESFLDFCNIACYCADAKSAARARTRPYRHASGLDRVLNARPSPYNHNSPPSDAATSPESFSTQCATNCTKNADCAGGENGCTCKTQSEQYVPGKGMVMFTAACIISLGGKREEQRPCPCNETYVSHACCGSPDGIVQESSQLKLGEVLVTDEL